MKMTMMLCHQSQPSLLQLPTGGMDLSVHRQYWPPQKEKVVVVMGATGTGKSRLSIDLAGSYPAEIINSDKMQVYEGLEIVTNKISDEECDGVPHHLLGIVDPESDFTPKNFVTTASITMQSIVGRGKLPIIAGGSNSFIEALFVNQDYYDVCFLWVDVAMPVLHRFVSDRVDRMVNAGIVEEVRKMYKPNADYTKGIRRAIGVPEFDAYFRSEYSSSIDKRTRDKLLEEAINETKINTCKLACRQLEKIRRLKNVKDWKIHRLDATGVFQKRGRDADKVWAEMVAGPGSEIVEQFLYFGNSRSFATSAAEGGGMVVKRGAAMAGVAR